MYMELVAGELNLFITESILFGVEKEEFYMKETHETDINLYFLCFKLSLTLIYN